MHFETILIKLSWPDFRTQRYSLKTRNVSRHCIGNNVLLRDPGNHM